VHILGRAYQELSEETGTPIGTLRTRAFYALRAMREMIDAGEEDA